MQSTGDEGRRENCGCGVCAAYKSYNIPGALEVAVAPREGDSLDKLMQEERAHFRVGAIWRGKRGPFLSF